MKLFSRTTVLLLASAIFLFVSMFEGYTYLQYQLSLPVLDNPIQWEVLQPAEDGQSSQAPDETAKKIERLQLRTYSRANRIDPDLVMEAMDSGAVGAVPAQGLPQMGHSDEFWGKVQEFSTGGADDPMARERWFWQARSFPADEIPADIHTEAIQVELQGLSADSELFTGDTPVWTELGPSPLLTLASINQNASGRALTIAVHPASATTLLLGTAQGGIWRSTDSGASWSSVADNMPSLAIKVIRFTPSNPNIVYAGTGEPHSSSSIYGQGVLKSTDGGQSWVHLPPVGSGWDFRYASISSLQVHPTNPNTLYVKHSRDLFQYIQSRRVPANHRHLQIHRRGANLATAEKRCQLSLNLREWHRHRVYGSRDGTQ
jgi:hypothetical protein